MSRTGLLLTLIGVAAAGCSAEATNEPLPRGTASAGTGGAPRAPGGAAPMNSIAGAGAASVAGAPAGGAGSSTGGAPSAAGGAPSTGGGGQSSTGAGGSKCSTTGPTDEIFFDGFEDGEFTRCPNWVDAEPALGGMWSVKADGTGQVLAQTGVASDWILAVSGSYKVTDQIVQAKVKFTSEPGIVGIFARVQDLENYYSLSLDGSNIILRGRVDNRQLTSVKVKTATVQGTWYTLKLSVIGSTLTGYLDGVQLVTTTDASVKSGGIAVGTDDSATAEFDDVTVTAP